MGHVAGIHAVAASEEWLWYPDRHWLNVFPGNATFTSDSFNYIDARTAFFTYAYSTSPGMAVTWTTSARSIRPLSPTPTAIS